MFCEEYWAERAWRPTLPRFHNIYGPNGTWFEAARRRRRPCAARSSEAQDFGDMRIEIWGDARRPRSYCFIEDCVSA